MITRGSMFDSLKIANDNREEIAGGLIAFVIGWVWVSILLTGLYGLVNLVAAQVGWESAGRAIGVIAIVGFVWIYMKFDLDRRRDELRGRIERLERMTIENCVRSRWD